MLDSSRQRTHLARAERVSTNQCATDEGILERAAPSAIRLARHGCDTRGRYTGVTARRIGTRTVLRHA
jgi:hypothetical protein